ncbi:MAG: hypothetical protein IJV82_01750 [Oscillospiraceae bacterium]|nr:hypothetical protein [Oscillospiraceae bacterium]
MTKKEVIRCVAFFIVVCVVLVGLTDIFEQDHASYGRRFNTYRNFEKNTVDAVYLGTSGVERYWIGPKAYEEYGMTVYPLAVEATPVWLYTNLVDEAFAYQNPQLLIFDTRPFVQSHTAENADVRARRVLDSMEIFSINRMKTALKTMKVIHSLDDSKPVFDASFIFSFAKFHTKWSDSAFSIDTQYDKQEHEYGGFYVHYLLSIDHKPQTPIEYDENYYEALDPLSEESLYELLDYTQELGVQVLFVDSPQYMSKQERGRANTVRKILQERGAAYLSYNFTGDSEQFDIQLDPETDYYDDAHVNYYGAEKFTASLAAYLDEQYHLPDRRSDDAVRKDWDGVYDHIKKTIANYEAIHAKQDAKEAASSGD